VFALYDALFNTALVVAAVLTAVALPENGHTPRTAESVAAIYVAAAAAYLVASLVDARRQDRVPLTPGARTSA
jgi:uncharacterized PurR-regulated membrane protein YhhQ (DUF165 family)